MKNTNTITFNKPTANIQRAFGIFAQLEKLKYTRKNLNPSDKYFVIDRISKTYYSTGETQQTPIDIPSNYRELLTSFVK